MFGTRSIQVHVVGDERRLRRGQRAIDGEAVAAAKSGSSAYVGGTCSSFGSIFAGRGRPAGGSAG